MISYLERNSLYWVHPILFSRSSYFKNRIIKLWYLNGDASVCSIVVVFSVLKENVGRSSRGMELTCGRMIGGGL